MKIILKRIVLKKYISGKEAKEKYSHLMGIEKSRFYEKLNERIFICGRIGTRILIWEQSIIEYLEKTPEEREGFVQEIGLEEHWRIEGHKDLGKWATAIELGTALGISPRIIRDNEKKIKGIVDIYSKMSGKKLRIGKINSLNVCGMMKDIDA